MTIKLPRKSVVKQNNSIAYYLTLGIIFSAPLGCYRIPVFALASLSLVKILLVLAWGIIGLKFMLSARFRAMISRRLSQLGSSFWFAFFFFLIVNIIMLFRSQFLGYGLKMIGLLITGYFLALLLYVVLASRVRVITALKVLIISSFPSAIFSLWQLYSFYQLGFMPEIPFIDFFPLPHEDSLLHRSYMWYLPGVPRILGFLTEPNSYGLFLAICLFCSFCLLTIHREQPGITKPWLKIIILSVCLNLPVFIFTFSRSGWLTLVFGFIMLLFYKRKLASRFSLRARSFPVLFVLIALSVTTVFIIGPNVLEERIRFSGIKGHIDARLASEKYVEEYPLFGIGYGSYGIYTGERFGVSSTHSYYINFLVEGGIVGFFAFLMFCLSLLAVTYSRKDKLPFILIFMILINNIFYHTFFLEITWVIVGLSFAMRNLNKSTFVLSQNHG